MNQEKIIVALDLDTPEAALGIARRVSPIFPFFKIGMRLFTKAGPELVRAVRKYGDVFLDLKFYDIPTVVAEAVWQASQLGVSLLTIHASGGSKMMKLSTEKLRSAHSTCRILGVTVLTSTDSLSEFGIERPVPDHVRILAELAHSAGTDGIVCSPAEISAMRSMFPSPFLLVTPGIRAAGEDKGDQKRTASAVDAIHSGADYLVIGRPIVAAPDPVAAAERLAKEIDEI